MNLFSLGVTVGAILGAIAVELGRWSVRRKGKSTCEGRQGHRWHWYIQFWQFGKPDTKVLWRNWRAGETRKGGR